MSLKVKKGIFLVSKSQGLITRMVYFFLMLSGGWARLWLSPGPVGKKDSGLLLCVSYLLTPQPHSQHFWHQMWGWGCSPPNRSMTPDVPQFNSVLMQLPGNRVRSYNLSAQVPQDNPPSPFPMLVRSRGCHLCCWPIIHRSSVSTTLSTCLINLLEQLIELRKGVPFTICLL